MMDISKIVSIVVTIVERQLSCEVSNYSRNTSLSDMGADDLDRIEIVMQCEECFGIELPDDEIDSHSTIVDLASLVLHKQREKAEAAK